MVIFLVNITYGNNNIKEIIFTNADDTKNIWNEDSNCVQNQYRNRYQTWVSYYTPHSTAWFLDIKISHNIRINTYPEGLL